MPAGFGNYDAVAVAREYFKRLDAGDDAILDLFTGSGNCLAVEGTTSGVLKDGQKWAAGETPAGRFCNIFEFRKGLISRLHVYLDPDYASKDEDSFLWGHEGRQW